MVWLVIYFQVLRFFKSFQFLKENYLCVIEKEKSRKSLEFEIESGIITFFLDRYWLTATLENNPDLEQEDFSGFLYFYVI